MKRTGKRGAKSQAPKVTPATPAEKKPEPPMDHGNMPGMKKMP